MLFTIIWFSTWLALCVRSFEFQADEAFVSPQDISALYDFYTATNGSSWHCEDYIQGIDWNFDVPNPDPCTDNWIGIWCWDVDPVDGYIHISTLSLGYCNIYGYIPEGISNLTKLQTFQLNNNFLTQSIPDSITSISTLTTLNLEENQLTGTLPSPLSALLQLQQVYLDSNQLHGSLPSDIGKLNQTLTTLSLNDNQLTGTLPPSLYDLTKLDHLDLSDNNFNGSLSSSVGQMTKLTYLALSSNEFVGSLPSAAFCDLYMYTLYLSDNNFVGTLPYCIGNWLWLNTLHVDRNAFIGSIPASFVNLTGMNDWNMEYNQLTGTLPDFIGNVIGPSLYLLILANNLFHGSIPDSYCGFSQMYTLFMGANHLTGTLPTCMDGDHYPSLQSLNLSNNHLHGPIPVNLSSIPHLVQLILNNNEFSGRITKSVCDYGTLNTIHLQYNQLEGTLSDCMMSIYNAGEMWIQNNLLTGFLPSEEWTVQVLDLSNNFFSGPINFEVVDTTWILSLTLSGNLLSGTLPYNWNNFTNLESLFVSNNLLSGSLDSLFVTRSDSHVLNIDLSDNQFTGTLPSHLFSFSSLESFAAVSNCLHGSLPAEQICSLVNLTTLALDGLMASPHCQHRLVPYSSSYQIEKSVTGGVPSCLLYDMTSLQILHLSGNGIDGTIPDHSGSSGSTLISATLQDLSLSHNELTGTIPLSIQQHTWSSLDLSYNKLTGTLKGSIYGFLTNATSAQDQPTLSLQVNRLSGPVPSALWDARALSILDGNLFSCLFDRSDLPKHDSDISVYECGSNTFNYAVFIWLIFAVVILVFAVLVWMTAKALKREHSLASSDGITEGVASDARKKQRKTTLVYISEHITAWQLAFSATANNSVDTGNNSASHTKQRRSLIALGYFVTSVRAAFLRLTLFIVCFLMPLFALLTHYFNTYTYEYAWTLSISYLSGVTAGVVMTVLLILLLVFSFALYSKYYHNYLAAIGPFSLLSITTNKHKDIKWPVRWYLALSLVAVLNVILVMAVNVLYVYVNITYSGDIVRLAQVCVAAFKLGWSSTVLRRMLKWTRKFLRDDRWKEVEEEDVDVPLTRLSENGPDTQSYSTASDSVTHRNGLTSGAPAAQHIGVEVCLVLFNNIAAPFIATLFVSTNCFYNVIVAPPEVQVNYQYTSCNHWIPHAGIVVCMSYGTGDRETSYSPPFTYSYQCSSTIVSYYAAIYVFMLLFIGFLVPAAQCGIKLLQQVCTKRGRGLYAVLNHCLPVLLRSRKRDHPNPVTQLSSDHLSGDESSAAANDRVADYSSDNSSHGSISLLRLLVDLDVDTSKQLLFECDLFIIRILNLLAILLTFGTVFPPLAVVVCVALVNFTYFSQILIGRFINVAASKGHMRVSELLAAQCDHAALMFAQSVWIVVPFAVLFYCLFVLDTIGDSSGGIGSSGQTAVVVWVSVSLVALCVSPFVIWWFGASRSSVASQDQRSGDKTEEDVRRRFNDAGAGGSNNDRNSECQYAPVDDSTVEEGQVSYNSALLNKLIIDENEDTMKL